MLKKDLIKLLERIDDDMEIHFILSVADDNFNLDENKTTLDCYREEAGFVELVFESEEIEKLLEG